MSFLTIRNAQMAVFSEAMLRQFAVRTASRVKARFPEAVAAMTSSSRSRRTTPRPSSPGIFTSRKTSSGSSFRISSTASSPLEPRAITSISGKSRSR